MNFTKLRQCIAEKAGILFEFYFYLINGLKLYFYQCLRELCTLLKLQELNFS